MNPNCERNDERLLALLLDELEPAERVELETHLETCERCRAERESLRLTVERLHQSFDAESAEPRLSPQRVAELKAGNVESLASDSEAASRRRFNPARWGMLAAVALFGVVGITVLVNEGSSPSLVRENGETTALEKDEIPLPEPLSSAPAGLEEGAAELQSTFELNDRIATAVPMAENQDLAAATSSETFRAELEVLDEKTDRRGERSRIRDGDDAMGGRSAGQTAPGEKSVASSPALAAPRAMEEEPARVSNLAAGQSGAGSAPQAPKKEAAESARQFADAPVDQLRELRAAEPGRPVGGIMPPPRPKPAPSLPNDAEFDAMYFQNYGVNPFIDTAEDPQSTFAVDVDTASYTIVRNYLNRGVLPPPEAVRVEEFVNYFNADYPAPDTETFAVYSELAPSPFRDGYSLLRVGIKGREIPVRERKPAVLTFVVDVSGSMAREDRLGLVKRTLATLLRELHPGDRVGLAVYGSRGEEILSHHDVVEEGAIERGIARLQPGGSTNAEEGLRIGYAMARRAFDPEAVNRVILCTDGVANVGRTGADSILNVIGREAEDRIYLTTLGFGLGNYNDVLLEQLADKGNGHYAYLDTDQEALSFIRRRLAGSMEVIAQDVKIQVELDPAAVRKYRLLGYENRDIADRDFRNDRVDAGEINAGHSVTALYELKLEEGSELDELGVVRLRFKDPDAGLAVREIEGPLDRRPYRGSFGEAGPHFRQVWIAAQFAEVLRQSIWAREITFESLIELLDESTVRGASPEVAELRDLIVQASRLMPREMPEPLPMQTLRENGAGDVSEPRSRREDEVRMLESTGSP